MAGYIRQDKLTVVIWEMRLTNYILSFRRSKVFQCARKEISGKFDPPGYVVKLPSLSAHPSVLGSNRTEDIIITQQKPGTSH
jgi:hypothetical protein